MYYENAFNARVVIMHVCEVLIYCAACGVLKRRLKLSVHEVLFDLQQWGPFWQGAVLTGHDSWRLTDNQDLPQWLYLPALLTEIYFPFFLTNLFHICVWFVVMNIDVNVSLLVEEKEHLCPHVMFFQCKFTSVCRLESSPSPVTVSSVFAVWEIWWSEYW